MARTGVEKVGQQLPRAPVAKPLTSRIPWTVWILLALGVYAFWSYLTQRSKRSKQPRRRIATKAEPRRPTGLDSPRRLGSAPKLSRRSSFARGVQGPTSESHGGSQTTSRAGSPFRPSFSSSRLAHLAQSAAGTPASSSTAGRSRHANSFGPDMSEVSFQGSSYLPHSPLTLGQRYILANRSNGLLRSASSYLIDSRGGQEASPGPRRSGFSDVYSPNVLDSASRKRRDFDTESLGTISQRSEKRFRMTDNEQGAFDEDDQDSDDAAMELDEMVEVAAAEQKRGTKRGPKSQGGHVKRTRQGETGDDAPRHENDEMDTKPDLKFLSKKRTRPSRDVNESFAEESAVDKRPRNGIQGKGGSKRRLDLVDTPTEEDEFDFEDEDSDDDRSPRNADSEVDEEEELEQDDENREQRRNHKSKRARSMEERTESGEDSLMGDDDYEAEAAADAPLASSDVASGSSRKRDDPTKASVTSSISTEAGVNKPVRRPGDTWVNLEGDRCRMDTDGKQRKLCEVREMRRKYKMPKDSIHPDAKTMHVVVTEKWLTQDEYTQLLAQGKLAWQAVEDKAALKAGAQSASDSSTAPQNKAAQTKPKGIYFATGTRTPLRTHSVLSSRPSSGSASPVSTPQSPAYATLLNGRMRLPSGAHASPARSWSTSKSARLVEDEQKAKAERERRRRASIMLGGEDEEKEVAQTAPAPPAPASLAAPPSTLSAPSTQPAVEPANEKKDDQPTPSYSFGQPHATTSAPPSSSATPPSFFSKPAVAAGPEAAKAEGAPKSAAPPSFFADVTRPQSNATLSSAEPAKAASFSFGAPSSTSTPPSQSAPSAAAAKAPFSFGAPPPLSAAPSTNVSAPSAASSAPFSFGAATSSSSSTLPPLSRRAPNTASPATFNLGAASTASATAPASGSAPAPSFGFGAAPDQLAAPTAAPAPSFSFGSTSAGPPPPASTSSTGGFAFGAPSTPFGGNTSAAPAPATAAPAPSFSFGAATTPAPVAQSSAPSFSFGNAASGSAPALFNFGSSSANASGTASPAGTPSVGQPFMFGQSTNSFGSVTGASIPAQSPGAAPAVFNFGSGGDESTGSAPRRRIAGRRPAGAR
ncbi:BQ5605_C004g02834 [Microbotryum silenes-dioicae]|uniref:BQ5605_C004g02834 protein n=1 Tax=Microbotryum silenes-dioicae TaxID=796604 RepID=A0A2X0N2Z7_9BASI|nr:BQ5605_C004g02834 [Microbotryum silenes-dioicae]